MLRLIKKKKILPSKSPIQKPQKPKKKKTLPAKSRIHKPPKPKKKKEQTFSSIRSRLARSCLDRDGSGALFYFLLFFSFLFANYTFTFKHCSSWLLGFWR